MVVVFAPVVRSVTRLHFIILVKKKQWVRAWFRACLGLSTITVGMSVALVVFPGNTGTPIQVSIVLMETFLSSLLTVLFFSFFSLASLYPPLGLCYMYMDYFSLPVSVSQCPELSPQKTREQWSHPASWQSRLRDCSHPHINVLWCPVQDLKFVGQGQVSQDISQFWRGVGNREATEPSPQAISCTDKMKSSANIYHNFRACH